MNIDSGRWNPAMNQQGQKNAVGCPEQKVQLLRGSFVVAGGGSGTVLFANTGYGGPTALNPNMADGNYLLYLETAAGVATALPRANRTATGFTYASFEVLAGQTMHYMALGVANAPPVG